MGPRGYPRGPMIDPKAFRENPDRFRQGAADKGAAIDFDRLMALDERRRAILTEMEATVSYTHLTLPTKA